MFRKFYDVLLTIIICRSNPVAFELSTSFIVTSESCKSLFIMSITEFVKDDSVSFSRLRIPSITRSTVPPGRPIFTVRHLSRFFFFFIVGFFYQ